MTILEAYYDLKLRRGMKRYLLAEGKTLGQIDLLYAQFSNYLSRLKAISFYKVLLGCRTEQSFRAELHVLFEEKWAGYMAYPNVPEYFERYLHYLHTACALDSMLEIEGLEMPDDEMCSPVDDVTAYAKPYVRDGKLSVIANPLLIRRLKNLLPLWPASSRECIDTARSFYGGLLPAMTDEDWTCLIEDLAIPKTPRKSKATIRNVELKFSDGSVKVMSGKRAMEFVVTDVGLHRFLDINIRHKGEKLVTRTPDRRYLTTYKQASDGFWINLKGSVLEKVKTLRLITSFMRLPYEVNLTNNTVD